jgi:hypothetical protein
MVVPAVAIDVVVDRAEEVATLTKSLRRFRELVHCGK